MALKMRFVKMNCVVIVCCLSLVTAAIVNEDAQAKVVNYENTNDGSGNYRFSYETSNGIFRDEIGSLVNIGKEDEHMVVVGSYSYTDDDGKLVQVHYTADKDGFHVSPPIETTPVVQSISEEEQFGAVPPNVVATLLGK